MILKDKVALITGASRGIGKAIALRFAKEGAKIIVNYSKSEKEANAVVELVKQLGSDAVAIKADVSNFNEVTEMVNQSIIKFGKIDILVNNAGYFVSSKFENITDEVWDRTMDIDLKGVFYCIKVVSLFMKKQNSGKIVNISSIAAFIGSAKGAPYGIAKAGVVNLTKLLSYEFGKYNININALAPGFIKTDFIKEIDENIIEKYISKTPLKRIGEPDDVANAALFLVSSDSDYITGQTITIDGGYC